MRDSRFRRVFAGVTIGALALAGALGAATSAQAADTVYVTSIAPNESSYLGWHEGYANATPAFALRWDGLELGIGTKSQVLNGLVATGAAGLRRTETRSVPSSRAPRSTCSRVRPPSRCPSPGPAVGPRSVPPSQPPLPRARTPSPISGSRASTLGTIPADTPIPLSDLLAALDSAGTVAYSGFGVQAMSPATVASLTWDGTTYAFSRSITTIPVDSTVHVTAGEIRPDESTYPGWHEGYANATPAFSVTEAGLSLGDGTHSQIINGFATPLADADLASLITSAGVAVTSGDVHFQVPIFFGPDSAFATLRPAAPDVAFAIGDEWVATRDIPATATTPAILKNTPVVLGDLIDAIEANGDVQVLAFGVQADYPAVVTTITFNGVEYSFLPAPVVPPGTTPAGTAALAATGFEGAWIAPIGALALALGVGFLIAARRRAGQSA